MAHKNIGTSLLKGIALTIGGGVALGVGIKIGQGALAQEPIIGEPGEGSALDPVLDRLSGVEGRIGHVESVLAEGTHFAPEGPAEPLQHAIVQFETRLSSQDSEMAALRTDLRAIEEKNVERLSTFGASVDRLQSRLPALVEETVGTTFHQMEEKLHREIEATHARTLETFVDNIQVKVVQRITAFEHDLAGQAEAMNQLREYSLKTDQNMQRLLVGVDRLASEIARKTDGQPPEPRGGESHAAPHPPSPAPPPLPSPAPKPDAAGKDAGSGPELPPPEPLRESVDRPVPDRPIADRAVPDRPVDGSPSVAETRSGSSIPDAKPGLNAGAPGALTERKSPSDTPGYIPNSFLEPAVEEEKPRSRWIVPTVSAGAVAALGLFGWQSGVFSHSQPAPRPHTAPSASGMTAQASTSQAPPLETSAESQASRIDAARAFLQHREYAKAEEVYRSILKTDPQNREVVLALADVLYRQQKYEESAAVLKALSARPRQ